MIDFVVEDELPWFIQSLTDLEIELHYVVLVSDESTLLERLAKRGDVQTAERSLFLLKKLMGSGANQPFLCDTGGAVPVEIAEDILSSARFRVV